MKKIIIYILLTLWVLTISSVGNISFAAGDITKEDFTIEVRDFTPGGTQFLDEDATTAGTVNNVLVTILEKLIVIFWALATFIMTIGAGYMIIYHGQDEYLSKWKSIFIAGIIALVVALSAGVIVRIFTYLLY